MRTEHSMIDRPLLLLLGSLLIGGFFIFLSASLGLLARQSISFSSIAFNHLLLGGGGGLIAFFITSRIHYRVWRTYAPYLFGAALIATAAVFIPGIGFTSGGATRWLIIAGFSVQPAEFLKIAIILAGAALITYIRPHLTNPLYGIGGMVVLLGLPALILLMQPNTSALAVMTIAVVGMFFAGGLPWRDVFIAALVTVFLLGALVLIRPYILERVLTFFDPSRDNQGASYQIKQSLIAIGSGGIVGRGFGQSVQKFGYLPEPVGDSVFAIAAEEFGFVGVVIILLVFLGFLWRSLTLASQVPDYFGALLLVGFSVLITTQACIHIGALLGVFPLTGVPLPFVSHGGTALLAYLGAAGIMCNVSKYRKRQ